jgi:putative heme-binding domain-containing protein
VHSPSPDIRRNAVWALTRIDHPDARAGVREALSDAELPNVLAALHSVGLWRDKLAFDQLVELLKSKEPAIRREAATALGRIGNPDCIPALLAPLASTSDRFMEQALIFAMIEIDAREPVFAGLSNGNPKIQRGALLALDQMSHGGLTEDETAPLLRSKDIGLQKAALDVISRHSGWSKGVVDFLTACLNDQKMSPEQSALVAGALRSAIGNRSVQQLVGKILGDPHIPAETRLLLLNTIGGSRSKKLPSSWRKPLEICLLDRDEAFARQAVNTVSHFSGGNFNEQLETLTLDTHRPLPVRIEAAVAAVSANSGPPNDHLFDFLLARCASTDTEVVGRLSIAQALGNARLSPAQLKEMTKTVAAAGPLELPSLLKAYEEAAEPAAGEELFAALQETSGLGSLSAGRVQRLIDRYPKSLRSSAATILKKFGAATESQAARMKELEFALTGGDAAHGHDLFMGKAACSQCHRVNNQGANVGPDLSQIGEIRTRRDLLESIAFPSATFARGFEPVTVVAAGRTYTGILRGESPKEVTLLTPGRSETTIPRDDVEDILPSPVSIMPQGLDRNLTLEELQDVVAFLSSLKKHKGT